MQCFIDLFPISV